MSVKIPITPSPPSSPGAANYLLHAHILPSSPLNAAANITYLRRAAYIKLADLAALHQIDPSTCHVDQASQGTEHAESGATVDTAETLGEKSASGFPVSSETTTVVNEPLKLHSRKIPPQGGFNLCLLVGSIKVVVDKFRVDGSRVRLAEVLVGDETGTVSLRARDDQIDVLASLASANEGEEKHGAVVLRNCTVELFQNKHLRLAVTKWGKMTPYPDNVASTPEPPNKMNTEWNYSLADLGGRHVINQVDDDASSPQSSRATVPTYATPEKSPTPSYSSFYPQHVQYGWNASNSPYPPPHSPTFYGGWKQPYRPSSVPYQSYSTSLEGSAQRMGLSANSAAPSYVVNPRGSWSQQKRYQKKGPKPWQDYGGQQGGQYHHPSGPSHASQHQYYQPHRNHVYSPQHFTQQPVYNLHQRPTDSAAQYMQPQYFTPQYPHPQQRMRQQSIPPPPPPPPFPGLGGDVNGETRTFHPARDVSMSAPHNSRSCTTAQPLFPHQAAQTDLKGSYAIHPNSDNVGNKVSVPADLNLDSSSAGMNANTADSPHDVYYQHREQAPSLSLGRWLDNYSRPFSENLTGIPVPALNERAGNPSSGPNQQMASEYARREAQAAWQHQQQSYNPHQPSFQPYYGYPPPHTRMVYASHEEVAYSFDSAFTADESSYGASRALSPDKNGKNTQKSAVDATQP